MNQFSYLFDADVYRYGGALPGSLRLFLLSIRKIQTTNNRFVRYFYLLFFKAYSSRRHLGISYKMSIGRGLYLGHAYNITINPRVQIGEFCNIHKGVTIGQENRGNRKGVPIIGNKVWIGVNSTIVGNIRIGDDVMIAPNSFVNCDVPSHSVVIGNPCVIHHREDATIHYINNVLH